MPKLYEAIAELLDAERTYRKAGNKERESKARYDADSLGRRFFPSGSGIDAGSTLDHRGGSRYFTIYFQYHAMDENGTYDRWIDFTVYVSPRLAGDPEVVVKGRFGRYSDMRDTIEEWFRDTLCAEIPGEGVAA